MGLSAYWAAGRALPCALLLGCASFVTQERAPQPKLTVTPTPPAAPITPVPLPSARETCRAAALSPEPAAPRDEAILILLAGQPRAAATRFEQLAARSPEDLAAETLLAGSLGEAAAANARASLALGEAALALEPLARAKAPEPAPARGTALRLLAQQRNLITDDAEWFARNALPVPLSPVEAAPEHVAAEFRGAPLARVFLHPDHAVALYGDHWLVVSSPATSGRVYELREAPGAQPPLELNYAQQVGSLLVVQLSYNGYAAASGGRNGYVAAYDQVSGKLAWSSGPLVANAANFVVIDHLLITGYGFTGEPDALFVRDVSDGALRQRIGVHGAPSFLVRKGGELYVRTYDTDYVFEIAGAAASPAPVAPAAAASADPELACLVRAAARAIDARDPEGLRSALAGFTQLSGERPLGRAFERALERIERARAGAALDLWRAAPIRLPAPPFARSVIARPRVMPSGPAPRLVEVRRKRADPARALDPEPYRADRPYFIAPAAQGALPRGAPADIPSSYGRQSLRAIIPSGDRLLLIYGGRYLVVTRTHTVERSFDLEAFRYPPAADPQWKEFATQDATYAQLVDKTLYVCNGGGSYAREVSGLKGFVSAIDLTTGELRWRSDPLVCNATFAVAGDYLVTGYGFTDEADFLFLLRMADGEVTGRVRVASAPDTITIEDERVHVETYGESYEFELR